MFLVVRPNNIEYGGPLLSVWDSGLKTGLIIKWSGLNSRFFVLNTNVYNTRYTS